MSVIVLLAHDITFTISTSKASADCSLASPETPHARGTAGSNIQQVEVAKHLLEEVYSHRTEDREQILPEDIMILSPYKDQRRFVRTVFRKSDLEVHENLIVDAFQGQEAPFVIFLMTKPSDGLNPGFLADKQRLNVALSGVKKVLVIIGNLHVWNQASLRSLMLQSKKNKSLVNLLKDVTAKEHTLTWADGKIGSGASPLVVCTSSILYSSFSQRPLAEGTPSG